MTTTATKTYRVTTIERALAIYEVEAEDACAAAVNWQDGEFIDRDDEVLDTEGPCSVREQQPGGSWRKIPPSEWQSDTPTAESANRLYSVLLLYPDYANDGGSETYYAWVEAPDSMQAVSLAQRQAVDANKWDDRDPTDFAPLLVIEGHHSGQPMSNQ